MLYQVRVDDPWQLIQFSTDGRPIRSQLILPPPGSTAVSDLADNMQVSMQVMGMLPWLCDYLGDAGDIRDVQLLPLRCGWGVNAVLLHDCPIDGREAREQLEALGRTWAAAIAAGAQHEGAKRLGEQLAEANRALVETQNELTRSQALAALGEIAAGAAHEMNNPLTVISGRSQLLASTLTDPHTKLMAQQIVEQSHRISDMITALRMFAEPNKPQISATNFVGLLEELVEQVRKDYDSPAAIKVVVDQPLPSVLVDPEQIGRAITELLRNAIESEGCEHIELLVQIDPVDDRLKIQVTDDGSGLTAHTLAHAFDPFFSAKPAGRQPGLGLAHARRFVEAHGGQIWLENGTQQGAIATIRLDHWRGPAQQQRDAA
jgi:signal transduction histidine kinase